MRAVTRRLWPLFNVLAAVTMHASIRSFARRAVLTAAGSYVVKVTIGGKMVPGWPQPLQVVPGPAAAAKCWLTGDSLKVCTPCIMLTRPHGYCSAAGAGR